jgi:hypothetical protein
MTAPHGSRRSLLNRHSFGIALGLLLLAAVLAPAFGRARADDPIYELGDAPDSSNHFGMPMAAFPGVPALYPVVFDPALGAPQGPRHTNPALNGWLGQTFSREQDADQLPDADAITNIGPPANAPNRDRFDDGVSPVNPNGLNLPQCGQTRFRYIVTGAAGGVPVPNAYVNVWFDWNRDGDWADQTTCTTSAGAVVTVYEWAVQNQPVTIVPGGALWWTPWFYSLHGGNSRDTWMRITIAHTPAPPSPAGLPDGRGPAGGYVYGETEDYFVVYSGVGTTFKPE